MKRPMSLRRERVKRYVVSTIALDRDDPSYGYETMVFNRTRARAARPGNQEYCRYYQTAEEAIKGHEELIQKIRNGFIP